jgi:heterodisulfide reductase subunit C
MKMAETAIKLGGKRKPTLLDELREMLPQGNLNLCLTCGLCSSGCPSSSFDDMDPRKFLRMLSLGMDEEILASRWTWFCSMCQRCSRVCPMQIDIPQMIYKLRQKVPREERPKGIVHSCDAALANESLSAMGTSPDDFEWIVNDVLEETQGEQPEFKDMEAPLDKEGAHFLVNQNSREPMTEPDEMVPLWKILHKAGASWTYPKTAWAAENYCLFMADDEGWEHITRKAAEVTDKLGCKIFLNTE